MRMTVFSDASFCHKTKASGYGAWAKADCWDSGRFFGGEINAPVSSPFEAEICGIANAVSRLKGCISDDNVDEIMIQCDSTDALNIIRELVPGTAVSHHRNSATLGRFYSGGQTPLAKKACEIIRGLGVQIVVRHVRGHKGRGSSRHAVNEECDKIAKSNMVNRRRRATAR